MKRPSLPQPRHRHCNCHFAWQICLKLCPDQYGAARLEIGEPRQSKKPVTVADRNHGARLVHISRPSSFRGMAGE